MKIILNNCTNFAGHTSIHSKFMKKYILSLSLLALFIGMFMFSCTPINNLEDPQKDVGTVVDSKLLIGHWYEEQSPDVLIEINDSLIIQHYNIVLESRYVLQGKELEIERLYVQETDSCCRYATCEYHLVDDTLYVKKFKHALVLPWHPTFIDAKLIRKKM